MAPRRRVLALLAAVGLAGAASPAADAYAPLRLGYTDDLFVEPGAGPRLTRAHADGAQVVRLPIAWSRIVPTPPASPADPADPAYDWGPLDASVRAASERGLTVLVTIDRAPAWAEGPSRPPDVPAGTWLPNAWTYGQFARAAALRYSGSTAGLPRVRYWQAWNAPDTAPAGPHFKRRRWSSFHPASTLLVRDLAFPSPELPGL